MHIAIRETFDLVESLECIRNEIEHNVRPDALPG
jgi:hypothetical protein